MSFDSNQSNFFSFIREDNKEAKNGMSSSNQSTTEKSKKSDTISTNFTRDNISESHCCAVVTGLSLSNLIHCIKITVNLKLVL